MEHHVKRRRGFRKYSIHASSDLSFFLALGAAKSHCCPRIKFDGPVSSCSLLVCKTLEHGVLLNIEAWSTVLQVIMVVFWFVQTVKNGRALFNVRAKASFPFPVPLLTSSLSLPCRPLSFFFFRIGAPLFSSWKDSNSLRAGAMKPLKSLPNS